MQRKSPRFAGYDYSLGGAYFVTICTQDRRPLLGSIIEGAFFPSQLGIEVEKSWLDLPDSLTGLQLDTFCLMPDHFHGLFLMNLASHVDGQKLELSAVVNRFKSLTTRKLWALQAPSSTADRMTVLWQRSYWDRIVRSEEEMERVREYISLNALAEYIETGEVRSAWR